MIFALLTLLAALGLAAVAGWFSIIGIMSIYAGAAFHALIMGIALESGKLVTTSWLYRNWEYAGWKLKVPLIIFTITLMLATSIGVFGFLSKAHLEQGAGTIDNSAKIARLDEQIAREKATIDDDQKVTQQLDATINSYLGKDRTDRSLAVRKSQAPQRKQLRDDIDAAQKRIDGYSDEKLKLNSQLRQQQLDVGPIRYIAELWYGADGNAEQNIESAVRIFTLIIVSSLDPLAVILLIAANQTLLRRQREKEEQASKTIGDRQISDIEKKPSLDKSDRKEIEEGVEVSQESIFELQGSASNTVYETEKATLYEKVLPQSVETLNEKEEIIKESDRISQEKSSFLAENSLSTEILYGTIEDTRDRLYEHSYEESITPAVQVQFGSEVQEINEEVEDTIQGISQGDREASRGSLVAASGNVFPKTPTAATIRDNLEIYSTKDKEIQEVDEKVLTFDDHLEDTAEAEGMLRRDPVIVTDEDYQVDNLENEQSDANADILEKFQSLLDDQVPLPVIRAPSPSRLEKIQPESIDSPTPTIAVEPWKKSEVNVPWSANQSILAQLIGSRPHFIPQKLNEEIKNEVLEIPTPEEERTGTTNGTHKTTIGETETLHKEEQISTSEDTKIQGKDTILISSDVDNQDDKYPKALSWLNEFKRT